jgi:anaerobic ribonucleoside-triphosphate reductase activating protein
MIKYKADTVQVVFEEIPDEVTLAIEITNCPGMCVGCHSPWLRDDIGDELTPDKLFELIDSNKGITCVCFMGEGKDPEALKWLAMDVRVRYPHIKTALYSGRTEVEPEYDSFFDYIKVGPYIPEFGPLNNKDTNQRLYEIVPRGNGLQPERVDITYKFWRDGESL